MPETPVLDGPLTDEVAADDLVIDLRQVVKSFGRTTALAGLDLSVRRGEVHAFLGPNGAGKTTTLRLLLGLLHADGGSMRVLGRDPWTDVEALHRRLAYVPGDVTLWPNLSGGEVIELLGRLRGGGVDPQRRDEMVARFDLDPTKRSRTYSKGNRQKVALVAALASNVDLYLLDEPTAGLDPLMEATFRDCVRELRAAGKTILLSSHILSEAEAVSDRVSLVRQGIVVETGTLAELRHLTRTSVSARVRSVPPGLDEIPGVHGLQVAGPGTGAGLGDGPGSVGAGTAVTAQVDGTAMSAFVGALAEAGIESLVSQPPTLEELFLRLYGRRAA